MQKIQQNKITKQSNEKKKNNSSQYNRNKQS